MQIDDMTAAHIQEIQHTANETRTKVTLTGTEMISEVEATWTLTVEPVSPGFSSNV